MGGRNGNLDTRNPIIRRDQIFGCEEVERNLTSVVKKQVFLTLSATYFLLLDHSTANAKGISSSRKIHCPFLVYWYWVQMIYGTYRNSSPEVSRMNVIGVSSIRRKESSKEEVPFQRKKASFGFVTQACTDARSLSECSQVLYTIFIWRNVFYI